MTQLDGSILAPEVSDAAFSFEAVDVTGTHAVVAADIQPSLPAGAVAKALADRMALPDSVPWGLMDESSSFLDDQRAIGDQIAPGSKVMVTPKTHLG